MYLLMDAFRNESVIAYSPETVHCPGSAQAFGFPESAFLNYPGGPFSMARLLTSQGNKDCQEGRLAIEELRQAGASKDVMEEFSNGEGFKKNLDLTLQTYGSMPRVPENQGYVIIKPLKLLENPPELVIFLADALALSALMFLANYARPDALNVIFPFSSGCWSISGFPFTEIDSPQPRAVVGLADISARVAMKRLLGKNYLSFTMPWKLYTEMEENAEESFLTRPAWGQLAAL
jgi:hypothetical protein